MDATRAVKLILLTSSEAAFSQIRKSAADGTLQETLEKLAAREDDTGLMLRHTLNGGAAVEIEDLAKMFQPRQIGA